MANIFEQVTRLDNLRIAWEKVHGNRGASDGDGQTLAGFAANLETDLLRLSRHLRDGTYRPGPLRAVSIAKKSGGIRTLAIPPVRDRIVQTAVATALTPIMEPQMEDCSFAYRPNRSVAMAPCAGSHGITEKVVLGWWMATLTTTSTPFPTSRSWQS